MRQLRIALFLFVATICVFAAGGAYADVDVRQYDSAIYIQRAALETKVQQDMDIMLASHPMLSTDIPVINEQLKPVVSHTFDFYIVLGLVLFIGFIRFSNPRYFLSLVRAFRSPGFSNKQLKDQLETASLPNMLMNIFFALSAGVYLYFIFKLNFPQRYGIFSPSIMLLILIASVGIVYAGKYFVMMFSGWVFNIKAMTGHYMYNVLLINKVISVILLPFTLLIAFADPGIAAPAMILSFVIVILLFINRYARSWQVLGSVFQYNKFHFFMYLCASEILPMAILTKLLVSGIFY